MSDKVLNRLLIPSHKCKNCGHCCGPIPINKVEFIEIQNFINKNKPDYNKNPGILDCKFRIDKKCSIYKVRPILCRLMGVTKGMTCNFGNSKEINGLKFFDINAKPAGLLNKVAKTDY